MLGDESEVDTRSVLFYSRSNNHASNLCLLLDSRPSRFFPPNILAISRLKMNACVWFHQQGDMGEDGPKGEMGEKVRSHVLERTHK